MPRYQEDILSEHRLGRPRTPDINLELLQGFDVTKQKISHLILNKDEKVELTQQSKPVRETLKANFGVSYIENVSGGGSVNVKITGKSYYECPGRTMRKDELENKQARERASKVADFRSSRMGEVAASEDHGMGSTSYASGFAASQNPRTIEHKGGKEAIEKGLSASHTGDSLF